jgi:hypothetical protein
VASGALERSQRIQGDIGTHIRLAPFQPSRIRRVSSLSKRWHGTRGRTRSKISQRSAEALGSHAYSRVGFAPGGP